MNAYDTEIEAESFRLLARRSPVAGDLRVILAVTRAVTDLERDREFEAALRRLMTVAMEQPQLAMPTFVRDLCYRRLTALVRSTRRHSTAIIGRLVGGG